MNITQSYLLPQPFNILLRNSPGPPHLIGWDSLRPKSSVDRLWIDVKLFRQFIDGEIFAHDLGPPLLPETFASLIV